MCAGSNYPTTTGRQLEPTNAAASVGLGEQRLNASLASRAHFGSKPVAVLGVLAIGTCTPGRLGKGLLRHELAGGAKGLASNFGLLHGLGEDHCEHG